MHKSGDEFLKKLLATFQGEADEHVKALSTGLIELEKGLPAEKRAEIVETVFREAHSLKGAARAVNVGEIERVCQSLESVFAAVKRGQTAFSPPLFDLLHQAVDTLGRLRAAIATGPAAADKAQIAELERQLESAAMGLPLRQEKPKPAARESEPAPQPEVLPHRAEVKSMPAESVRIATAKLDALLLQTEELLSAKLAAGQLAAELRAAEVARAAGNKEWVRLQPDLKAMQQRVPGAGAGAGNGRKKPDPQAQRVLEFLEWEHARGKSLEGRLAALASLAEQNHRTLGGMVDSLLEDAKKALMLPFASLLEVFPKVVRDLARDRGKDAELHVQGGEIEIDRRILEAMKDPLLHLVRNCVDHGIEKPEERERKKKQGRGRVTVAIVQKDSNKVELEVSDDGAGIDVAAVRAAAAKLGLVSREAAAKLDERQVLSFIYQSGVSTTPIITDISGRGLGLAIVREKVEKLGGRVSLETRRDAGTTFRIVLPLTLATFRGVLVRAGERLFVLPTASVERVVGVGERDITTVENEETIPVDGQAVALVRLGNLLKVPRKDHPSKAADKLPVVILGSAEKRIAFQVDEVLGEQEVLVKGLGPQLVRVRNVAGATVLGTGEVVPILNVPDLMKSAVADAPRPASAALAPEEEEAGEKSVLVVEDSITARALLKSILESAGYNVRTAVDGVDAFATLRTEEVDVVVSDVDMPRMNGFDLTARIRGDKKLAELPVVLVTALGSREDRERGISVGANAYIVKSSFDQSNLLEVLRRLA